MFSKSKYNELTNLIEREDYLTESLIAPTVASVRRELSAMTLGNIEAAMAEHGCTTHLALESRLVGLRVREVLS